MNIQQALEQEQQLREKAGKTTHYISRQSQGNAFFVFQYGDEKLGWAYTGQIAGLPPYHPLSEEDRQADDWYLHLIVPFED